MAGIVLKPSDTKPLRQLLTQLAGAMAETLGSLIARELVVRPGKVESWSNVELLASLTGANALIRGALDKDYAGKHLYAMFEVRDAVAMAGMLMMTPDHVIEQRRGTANLEAEDAEAFGEIGNVLCSGLGNVLRDNIGNIDLRLLDHGLVQPGNDERRLLDSTPLVAIELELRVAAYPATTARLLIDRDTAQKWNQGPLEVAAAPDAAAAAAAQGQLPRGDAAARSEEESLDDVPAAPVRGVLNAFLANPDSMRLVRRCCRRVGFELRRYGRSEIPNPAAHRNEVVLLDVPLGEERRFDWCRRIKDFNANIKTVLLLHRPSRARVTQAFLSQADIILGWPCHEGQLGAKLDELLGQPSNEGS